MNPLSLPWTVALVRSQQHGGSYIAIVDALGADVAKLTGPGAHETAKAICAVMNATRRPAENDHVR
jgi:hypothetical protein